jgi:proline dehydrogenase
VKSINDATLEEEEELVIEMLTEEGISEDDFADTYKKILTAVFEDPKNFNKQGVRKSGRVVNIARRAIKEMTSGKATDDAKKKAEEKIASERQIKATLLNARKTGKEFTKSDDKVFKNTEEVVEEILKDYRSKVK